MDEFDFNTTRINSNVFVDQQLYTSSKFFTLGPIPKFPVLVEIGIRETKNFLKKLKISISILFLLKEIKE